MQPRLMTGDYSGVKHSTIHKGGIMDKKKKVVYAISVGFNSDEIKSHCWGECGKGRAAGMVGVNIANGEFLICDSPVCPIMEKEKELEDSAIDRLCDVVIVRKLKRLKKEVADNGAEGNE